MPKNEPETTMKNVPNATDAEDFKEILEGVSGYLEEIATQLRILNNNLEYNQQRRH